MITKLQNPSVAAGLSVMISVAIGVAVSWRTLQTITTQALQVHVTPETEELKRKGWDFWTIEIDNLSAELKDERARLRKQADLLDQRAARLTSEEKAFAQLRADVEVMRRQIGERLIEIKADESKNLKTLAATYTTLSPKAAVAIVRELDENTAVKILSLMKPDVVGPIFEEMGKAAQGDAALAQRAASMSEKLRLMKATKAANPS